MDSSIYKIWHIVLRERILDSKETNQTTVDIVSNKLLERWIISMEPSTVMETTDFTLLLQSIYCKTKLLPLGTKLSQDLTLKDTLRQGAIQGQVPSDFNMHQFRPVATSKGFLCVRVYFRNLDSETIKRQGSPFPSPQLQRKVLYFQKPPIPIKQSRLSRSIVRSSSTSSNESLENDLNNLQLDTPQKPYRRDSLSPYNGELFGSLVGSYEESILNGRMSTMPSRPISFLAEIGVIGTGKCKSWLKCPPHMTVEFPAYFYELQDDEYPITPYVGSVELEKSYRLPLKGQLQIMIKNPQCTAIKVFLIPYDLTDLPPKSKTFIRQKSYQKHSMRYAIHLNFTKNSKSQLHLTSTMRVVFAPRADGDEKMRVVTQYPDEKTDQNSQVEKWFETGGR